MAAPQYPEADYLAQVRSQAFIPAETGTMQFCMEFQLISYSDGTPCRPGVRTVRLSLTEKALPFVLDKLETVLNPDQRVDRLDELHPKARSFVNLAGNMTVIRCEHRQGTEGPYENWDIPFGEREPLESTATPDDIARLDAMFGGALQARNNGNGVFGRGRKPQTAAAPAPRAAAAPAQNGFRRPASQPPRNNNSLPEVPAGFPGGDDYPV